MTKMKNPRSKAPEHIHLYGLRLAAMRQLLHKLLDMGYFDCHRKEEALYNKAIITFCLSNSRACDELIEDGGNFRFRNHKRDKRGKLISVEAYLAQ